MIVRFIVRPPVSHWWGTTDWRVHERTITNSTGYAALERDRRPAPVAGKQQAVDVRGGELNSGGQVGHNLARYDGELTCDTQCFSIHSAPIRSRRPSSTRKRSR